MPEEKEHWRIDKHIPIVPMLSLVITAVGMVWWISGWMTAIEVRMSYLESWRDNTASVVSDVNVMKNQIVNMNSILQDIKLEIKDQNRKLEKIDESTKGN